MNSAEEIFKKIEKELSQGITASKEYCVNHIKKHTRQRLEELKEKLGRIKNYRESYLDRMHKGEMGYNFVRGELSVIEEIITLIEEVQAKHIQEE